MGQVCGIPDYPNEYHLTLHDEKAFFFFIIDIFFLDVQSMNFNIRIDSCDDHHN